MDGTWGWAEEQKRTDGGTGQGMCQSSGRGPCQETGQDAPQSVFFKVQIQSSGRVQMVWQNPSESLSRYFKISFLYNSF